VIECQQSQGVAGYDLLVLYREDANGGYTPASDVFTGDETFAAEIWPGSDRAVVLTPAVSWAVVEDAAVRIDYTVEDLALLWPGRFLGRVLCNEKPGLFAEFALKLASGPGLREARPVYHTFRDLKDEYPDIERLQSLLEDETGFADLSADARDWIDAEVLDAGRSQVHCWWLRRAGYADALAADGLDLATPGGRAIVRASVNKTIASIMRRAMFVTNAPDGLKEEAKEREEEAERLLRSSTARFTGGSLRSIRLGAMPVGRVVR
jgi:hypothetical protein